MDVAAIIIGVMAPVTPTTLIMTILCGIILAISYVPATLYNQLVYVTIFFLAVVSGQVVQNETIGLRWTGIYFLYLLFLLTTYTVNRIRKKVVRHAITQS